VNRRKHPRFQVELHCVFAGDQATGEGTVLDLAMEGCRVRSDTPAPNGAYVEVFITLHGQIVPLFIELAVIRWSAGPLFGLEFIRIAEGHQARLRNYVQDLELALMARVPTTSRGR
jgi:PilZ domain-containing protein